MDLSRDQNAGQSHNIKIGSSSFERVEQFKHSGTMLMCQYSIQEEIKSRLKSGNACCHLVENLLSYSLLSKNININIHRIIILPVILYGCETWLLTLRNVDSRVYENIVLRIFGPKTDKITGNWRKLCNEELNNLYASPNIIWVM
jgi:hypothetical protein